MTRQEIRKTLLGAEERAGNGYARDLLREFLCAAGEYVVPESWQPPSNQDADSLFRTLVLDEGWASESAEPVYLAALELATASVQEVAG